MTRVDSAAAVDRVLQRLERVKRSGDGWIARCPAHDDRTPSLGVDVGTDGRVLVTCHAGCSLEAILAALGFEERDLFDEPRGERRIVETYDYVTEEGRLLSQAVRFDPKGFAQRRPDGTGGWIWSLGDTRRVLYRLPEVLGAAGVGELIYIVEGEKDVHALEAVVDLPVTCNAMGAGKWRDEYAEQLRGASLVAIIPDDDEPGRAHAAQVAASVTRAGIPAKVVELWPPGNTHRDVSDFLAASPNGAGPEQARAALEAIIERTPPWQPPAGSDHVDDGAESDAIPIVFVTLREFLEANFPPAEALVGHVRGGTNLFPRYGWVIPWGSEGSTKTSLVVDGVFHGASGLEWLSYPIARPIRFVVIVNEGVPGGLQDKLAAKAETWEHGNVDDVIGVYKSPWGEFSFGNERMRRHLQDFARDFEADYVVGDPLHTIGTTGSGTPEETEAFKHLLRGFGLWDWIGVLTPHHVNKGGKISGDWGRHPDTLIHVERKAGQKQTVFTLEKARPADPDELGKAVLLDWETDTLSYRRTAIETGQKVSDDELLAGIYAALDEAAADGAGTVSITEMRASVTGNDDRIGTLVKAEIEAGRIHNSATKKGTYKLQRGSRNLESAEPLWADAAEDFG